jgi:hypothetical protein
MRTFFGLTDEYTENVYETFFFLKYAGGWSFSEAYNLPVGLRMWFVERLVRQLEMEKEAVEGSHKGDSKSQTLSAANQPQMPSQLAQQLQKKKSG